MSLGSTVSPVKRDRTSSHASTSKSVANGLQGRADNTTFHDEDAGSEEDDAPLEALLPLSHDHPLLGVDDPAQWSVDDFLLSRSHLPLEELRTELREYLARLREELGELINDDYEEFISLGLGLRGEGERLSALKQPLEELKGEVQSIQDSLASSQGVIESLLSERTQIRKQKELIDLLMHLTDALERTEGLLGLAANPGASTGSALGGGGQGDEPVYDDEDQVVDEGDVDTGLSPANGLIPSLKLDMSLNGDSPAAAPSELDLKTLPRVANEYTQVIYLLEKAKSEGCAFVEDAPEGEGDGERIQERVSAIRVKLRDELDRVFAALIASRSTASGESSDFRARVDQCLRAYQVVQEWSAAQQVIRRYISSRLATIIDSRSLLISPSPAAPATPGDTTPGKPKTPFTPFGGQQQSNLFELALANSANAKRINESSAETAAAAASQMSFEPLDETLSPLAGVYNAVLRFVDSECTTLLDVTEALNNESETIGGEARFDILADVIWTEVAKRITEEMGGSVFAAGRVGELHRNYVLTQAFLGKLESLAPSVRAVEQMRSSAAYAAFDRRWQLPVYFQLRWKEIVTSLEEALQQPIGNERGREGYVMPQTLAAFQAIRKCWSSGVYLPELAGRFWRLTLQILSRYRVWLEGAAPALFDPELQPNLKAQVQSSQTQSSTRNSLTLSRSSTPVQGPALPTGDPSTDPAAAAAEENVLRISTLIAIDLRRLKRDLAQFWTDDLSSIFRNALAEDQGAEIRATFEHMLSSLDKLMKSPDSHALSILTRRCAESLKLIRSVASQLRTSTTPSSNTPSPSHFVAAVFKPAKDYFGVGGVGEALKTEVAESWNKMILEEVIAGYAAILLSVRKTEDLLRRHRKGKKTGFSLFGSGAAQQQPASSVEAEEERFKIQMTTDIDALAREAKGLGVDATTVDGWDALRQVVESPVVDNP